MEIVNRIWNWLAGRKSLDKIPLEDLVKERLRLEQLETRITRDVDLLERRKGYLFTQGKDQAGQRKQVILARKIKALDLEVQAKDRQLALISRQLRIITGFITLRENEQMINQLGVAGIVAKLDMGELQEYVDQATVEGQFHMEKFATMMRTLEGPDAMELQAQEDPEILAIVQAMQDARAAEGAQPIDPVADRVDRMVQQMESDSAHTSESEPPIAQ